MVLIWRKGNRAEREAGERPRRRFQFRLATLFLATAVFAVASAGFAKGSIAGALGAVFGVWIILVGVICIWGAVRERSLVSLLALGTGIAWLLLGASFWFLSVF
jgi:hypothetical protein